MGAYYGIHVGGGNFNYHEGAEPGSHADEYIGDKSIYFARLRGMYDV